MSAALLWFAWLLTLLPLSVDNYLSLPIAGYHVRLNYLGAALLAALLAWDWLSARSARIREWLRAELREPRLLGLALFALAGCLGTALVSANRPRSVAFLIWSVGTLALVPVLAAYARKQLGPAMLRSFLLYGLAQSLVVIFDSVSCNSFESRFHLGRVIVYAYANGHEWLCRPQAGYQEPNYLASFLLLYLVFARILVRVETHPRWKRAAAISWWLGAVALLATTSRMGWLGLATLVSVEAMSFVVVRARSSRKRLVIGAIAALVVLGGSAAVIPIVWPNAGRIGQGLIHPSHDEGFQERWGNFMAAWHVFQRTPWVGAGPGGGGAYLVTYLPDDPWLVRWVPPLKRALLHRDPLSYSLYSELLSEWGILGVLGFVLHLALLFTGFSWIDRLRITAALGVAYMTAQTLPRFDLWMALALIQVTRVKRVTRAAGKKSE